MALGFRYFIERKLALKIEIPRSNVIIHLSNKGLWLASSTGPYCLRFWDFSGEVCVACALEEHT